ncbi:universal stress protein [Amycolatopsis sp. NPDC059027]|uniref:universal stress protein n=1 Tax=unclassified Amycolatopsis TaxID=2618356 RepID=UPI00366FFFCF
MTQQKDHRLIIIGLDGSPAGDAALRWALGQARSDDRLEALYVAPRDSLLPGTSLALQPHGRRPVRPPISAERIDAVRAEFADAAPVKDRIVHGDAASELVAASATADLLVVGARRTTALGQLVLGSVAGHCVGHAQCPVVVITPEAARRIPLGSEASEDEATGL